MANDPKNNRTPPKRDPRSGKPQNLSEQSRSGSWMGGKHKGHVASSQPPLRPKPKK